MLATFLNALVAAICHKHARAGIAFVGLQPFSMCVSHSAYALHSLLKSAAIVCRLCSAKWSQGLCWARSSDQYCAAGIIRGSVYYTALEDHPEQAEIVHVSLWAMYATNEGCIAGVS